MKINLDKYFQVLERIPDLDLLEIEGKVKEIVGLTIVATLPTAQVGNLCYIYKGTDDKEYIKAEVVGFRQDDVLLMPLSDISGIGRDSRIVLQKKALTVKVSEELLGRVLNGLGEPIDNKGELKAYKEYPIYSHPPEPLKRRRISIPIQIGIKAIDGVLTCGEGQRIGIFAAAGVGKSTLLGMIAKNTSAQVNVVALIGERGREVKEFIERDLGEEGLKHSVIVVATSDEPALIRLKAAYVATAIAEFFRDLGKQVVLMMDSITRFARAQREIGLSTGEPPTRRGFPPSVFALLPKLLERSGNSDKGSITAFYTVLVEGDDMSEPIADEVRSILDGHIILSRRLADRSHYPAIDVSRSISRVMKDIVTKEHYNKAMQLKELVAVYEENEELIKIEYKKGKDKKLDEAIEKQSAINTFLKQAVDEKVSLQEAINQLKEIL